MNIRALQKLLDRKVGGLRADNFTPELERSAKRVLRTCIDKTPTRGENVITTSQRKQYTKRANYIPSVHGTVDPTLIVKGDGSHWLYAGGQWYAATYRTLPSGVDGIYQNLLNERERRLQTSQSAFIADRVQARFLYRKSWWEVAKSAGLQISVDPRIPAARTRRKPAKNPPKGYAQWRGGKDTLSLVVFNPFLEQESRYKNFSGETILSQAIAADRTRLNSEVAKKIATLVS